MLRLKTVVGKELRRVFLHNGQFHLLGGERRIFSVVWTNHLHRRRVGRRDITKMSRDRRGSISMSKLVNDFIKYIRKLGGEELSTGVIVNDEGELA